MIQLHINNQPTLKSLVSSLHYRTAPSHELSEINLEHQFIKSLKSECPEKFLQLLDKTCDMSKLDNYILEKKITTETFNVNDFIKFASFVVGEMYFNTTTNTMMVCNKNLEWVKLG